MESSTHVGSWETHWCRAWCGTSHRLGRRHPSSRSRSCLKAVWQGHVSCVAKVQGKGDKVQQSSNQIKPHSTVVSRDAARPLTLAKEPKVSSISEVAECNTSQMAAKTVPATGMAIIDTGASHSGIGSDHVPAILRKLPPTSDRWSVSNPAISVFVLVTIKCCILSSNCKSLWFTVVNEFGY